MFDLTKNTRSYLNTYNPFREMEELERNAFGSFFGNSDLAAFKTDVTDEGDHYLLETDLPGFEKQDIHLDLQGDVLTLRAERHSKLEQKEQGQILQMERSYGSYSRQFDVSGVDTGRITAKYENGVLKLVLPKQEQVPPDTRQLEIE